MYRLFRVSGRTALVARWLTDGTKARRVRAPTPRSGAARTKSHDSR
jgi:hypothetical protein